MVNTILDASLIALSCAYAEWLSEHKEFEPDFTFVEVGAGVGYCLLHAYLRRPGGDWRDGQAEVVRSLILGGIPIAMGELAQWWRRRDMLRRLAEKLR